ncbi:MAG: DNA-directed DNA polymerase II small subunit [Methanomassiliicoccales archaeon]
MERTEILGALICEGIFLEEDAADFVLQMADPLTFTREAVGRMVRKPRLSITMDDLRTVVAIDRPAIAAAPKNKRHSDIEIVEDITGISQCRGSVEGFHDYFMDRFLAIKEILQRRRDMVNATSIYALKSNSRFSNEKEVSFIGMVSEVRDLRSGGKMVKLEDGKAEAEVYIAQDNGRSEDPRGQFGNVQRPRINLALDSVVPDEVIGVVAKPSANGKFRAVNIVRPDVPYSGGMETSDSTSLIGFMGDVHVGSNTFLTREWKQMTSWLRDNADQMNINYIHVPGDVVDGIGVFPGQEDELEIEDIIDQYKALSEHLKELPDNIKLLVQPGNHDYVRPAEPQPAFGGEIAKLFDSNVVLLGNPCSVRVEGRLITSYHGKSFDDLVAKVKGSKYQDPIALMIEMLKRRHMATFYGGRTPLAPERRDHLVIRDVPDIFVTGHVHGADISGYKGVRLINASTWQDQTPFQKSHNFIPKPAQLALVNLGNGKMKSVSFDTFREQTLEHPLPVNS